MKVGIVKGNGFSERWVEYCREKGIVYKLVDVYASDIVKQLEDCDFVLWHFSHVSYKDMLFAKQLLYSLQIAGKRVFPDFNTCWHFDDKVGQKYLLESVHAPLVPSYVFYTKKEALKWVKSADFPKVFKLRGGAGASNVRLVRSKKQAKRLVHRAFGKGFSQTNPWERLVEAIRLVKERKASLWAIVLAIKAFFFPPEFSRMHGKEKGYAYFQDFIPQNDFDIRVIVTGNKAIAIKRMNRKNDFRASGSGYILYDKNEIDIRCVKIAFEVNKKLQTQSIAYDFIFDSDNKPLIVELSYGYSMHGYDSCPGYWDEKLEWHEAKNIKPQYWQLENLISER